MAGHLAARGLQHPPRPAASSLGKKMQWKRTLTCGPGPAHRIVLGRGLPTVKFFQSTCSKKAGMDCI
jgi:hypothetical protein